MQDLLPPRPAPASSRGLRPGQGSPAYQSALGADLREHGRDVVVDEAMSATFTELRAAGVSIVRACVLIGRARASHYRHARGRVHGPRPADQHAGPHDADPGGAQLGERGAHRLVDDDVAAVLSEICSKSPCSFPMISTTAWEVASSRVSRWFSARNRPGSSLPPETVARCALRG